jgi:plastocyanin
MQKTIPFLTTRVWLGLLAVSLLVLLAACGGGTTTTTSTNTPAPAPTHTPTAVPTNTPTAAPTNTPTTGPSSSGNSVTVMNFAFSPATLTVMTGTKVTWTNHDTVTHTVTADQGAFNSGPLSPGNSFSFTFNKAGTYSYHYNIHHSMMATVIVQ